MNKTLLLILSVTLIGLFGVFVARFVLNGGEDTWICENNRWIKHGNPANPVPVTGCGTKSTTEAIAEEFSKKYNRPTDEFVIETGTDTGLFAKGSVRFKDEMGGALWFGAKTADGWELVSDGQGPMSCETANRYDMPKDMVPGCVDMLNSGVYIER